MNVLLRINPTRVKRFFRCENDWHSYAVLGITKQARLSSDALNRGKVMHAMLEHVFRVYAASGRVYSFKGAHGREAAKEIALGLHQREAVALEEDVSEDLLAAVRWHVPRLNLHEWEVVRLRIPNEQTIEAYLRNADELPAEGLPAVELDLRGSIGVDGVQMQAIVDLVLRNKATGKIWLIDWKTTAAPIDTSADLPYVEHDPQLLIGRELLKQNGIDVDISALVRFRSMAPKPPGMTGHKKVSVNKSKLACDWELFRQTLVDNREDPDSAKALAVKEYLKTAVFVQWRPDITNAAAEAYLLEDLKRTATRMLALSKGEAIPRRHLRAEGMWSPGGNCKKCEYSDWCNASLRNGGEPDLVQLGTKYRAQPWSPLLGKEQFSIHPRRSDAYVDFSSHHGYTVEPNQPFEP